VGEREWHWPAYICPAINWKLETRIITNFQYRQQALLKLNELFARYGDNVSCINELYTSINEQFSQTA